MSSLARAAVICLTLVLPAIVLPAIAGLALGGGACDARIRFDPTVIARAGARGELLADLRGARPPFLLGVASSAHQIEGGTSNDWTDWEAGSYPDGTPHVAGRDSAARAADSWNLWRKDVAAAEALGANVYRLGIEWSRLEPEEGRWDAAAAARYREMLRALRAARPLPATPGQPVEPMLNLYHFTLPRWLAARGGWEWPGAPAAFAAFAGRAAEAFGDLVDWWCTINEPNVYAVKGYLAGQWPPGARDPRRTAEVLARLLVAHGEAAAALRARDRADADGDGAATRVGIAHNVRIFDGASAHPLDDVAAAVADSFYNHSLPDAVATGRVRIVLPSAVDLDLPAPGLRGSLDWLGLNYYTREVVRARLDRARAGGPPYESVVDPARPRSDMGWEIYPEGLYRLLVRFGAYGWPLIVAENGIADAGGARRADFIRAHLYALNRARREGVDVRGYLYWSLTDNFEWSHGYRGRFGLFTIDFAGDPALERRPTPAVAVFRELALGLGGR